MADFKKGAGYGSMYIDYGTGCDPTNPNMGNAAKSPKTPHDNQHQNNKTVGGDVRGGGYKGKQQQGGIHSIPEHFATQNGDTKQKPNKRAKVTTGEK
jgi:hypothetical protein